MTKSTAKPTRHPTFTIDELRAIRRALVTWNREEKNAASALIKVTNAIVYRETYLPIHKGDAL